jgi:transposase-like protein
MTRIDKQKALQLRLQGKTYTEIRKELGGVSKSTLSLWLKDVVLSDAAKRALAARTKEKSFAGILRWSKSQTAKALKRKETIKQSAAGEVGELSDRELMLVGAALYWAEGYKRPLKRNGRELIAHYISFTNSDMEMAKVFLKCMTRICGVEVSRVKVEARIFKHHNADEVVGYWSRELGISKENFVKTYAGISSASAGKRPYNRLPYGVIQIRINSTDLFHRIMGWIEGLKKSL